MAERLLFVTGKLAAAALRDTLGRTELPFDYEVAVMKITVAALMTTTWIAGRLDPPEGVTKIMIPGLCEGETDVLAERFGIPVEKGPGDLKRLPSWFGQADARASYGPRDIRVFAEINHVPRLSRDRILDVAGYYRDAGADVIDLGLSLERRWLDEGPAVIAELRERGFVLSIDTMDPDEILMADEAGVDYVLSLNGSNRELAERLRATPVLIPDTPEDLDSLEATIAHLERLGKPYLVDPIIEPIGTGFAASLGRYLEVRRRHPDVEMFMGIGNLTELTEADSTGVTAMLIGFCQELGHPQRAHHRGHRVGARRRPRRRCWRRSSCTSRRSRARRPSTSTGGCSTVKDEDLRPYAESELRELHEQVTDPNFRIFADSDWIYVFNAELFVKGTDFNEIFDQLGVDEPTHAFYLGKELMKATIARALRKNYRQESPLDWGYMTFEEPRRERVRLPRGSRKSSSLAAPNRPKARIPVPKPPKKHEMPELDRQNGATLGRMLGRGSVGDAEEGSGGKMRATIRIPEDELVYEPGTLFVPHGGVLELTLINDDKNTHCAVLPSNGDTQFLWLVNHSKGTATLELDGPGYYWYGSTTGNDEGRGLTGAIVVGGDVPEEARLDRPPQPQP